MEKSPEYLAALPRWSGEGEVVDGFSAEIITLKAYSKDGLLRIILQLNANERPLFGPVKSRQMFMEGFEVQPSGEMKQLDQEEMYEY